MRRLQAGAVLLTALLTVSAALLTGGAVAPAAAVDGPDYFWRWSDGIERPARLIDIPRESAIPGLVVATAPATAGQRVLLQFRDGPRWRTEDAATTGRDGTARVELNPFCDDGDWCRRTFDYRLVAGGRTAPLRVTFR